MPQSHPQSPHKQPNLLVIVSDQHRFDSISHNGLNNVQTPNLDRLAAEGMRFTSAYTPIPLCCPARQAFLNGNRPETFGSLWNFDLGPRLMDGLEPEKYSFPRDLQQSGYATAYLGKWHVSRTHQPTEFGYDQYVGLGAYKAYREERYPDAADQRGFEHGVDPIPVEDSRTHWLAGETIRQIRQHNEAERPWHIRLDYSEPHIPCRPAGRFADLYDPKDMAPWPNFGDTFEGKPYIQKQQLLNWQMENDTWEEWAPRVASYFGIIGQMDDAIGLILSELDRLGIAENTVVVYTSDHGDMCGSHRMMDKHYVMYEEIVKVPLIVRWTGVVRQNVSCDEFVYNLLDLPPTLLDMAGARPTGALQGRALTPLLEEKQVGDWRQEVVSTYNGQQFGLYTQRMLRDRAFKYVWNTTDVDEFYVLGEDPAELHNRIHDPQYEPVIRDMRQRLYHTLLAEGDRLVHNDWMRDQLLLSRKL